LFNKRQNKDIYEEEGTFYQDQNVFGLSQKELQKFNKRLGKVQKLSNKGFSFNFRILRIYESSLAYYKSVPKDYNGETQSSAIIEEKK